MAPYSLPITESTPQGVGGIPQLPQVIFGTAAQLNTSPIVYGQGSVPLHAGVVDGVGCIAPNQVIARSEFEGHRQMYTE